MATPTMQRCRVWLTIYRYIIIYFFLRLPEIAQIYQHRTLRRASCNNHTARYSLPSTIANKARAGLTCGVEPSRWIDSSNPSAPASPQTKYTALALELCKHRSEIQYSTLYSSLPHRLHATASLCRRKPTVAQHTGYNGR